VRSFASTASAAPAHLRARGRRSALDRVTGIWVQATLGALVLTSAVVRSIAAVHHSVPRYFPDEYVYAALGRALAHGNLDVRGATAHFPAIVEPLLAAPLWRFFDTTTAYHLVQVENAIFASLAAIPIYLISRWLNIDRGYALLCAAFGLVLPQLTLAALDVSDLVAYPLILVAVAAALRALETPTTRRQLVFFGLAILATLTRVEYAVALPAYLVAAVIVERRRVFRAHRLAFAALVPVGGAFVAGVVGYYFSKGTSSLDLHPLSLAHWFVLQAFLMTVATGVVVVPGAVAALARPVGRRETVYAAFTAAFIVLVLAAATEPAAATGNFKQRYLFALAPLLAIAFSIYVKRRPLRPLVCVLAVAVAIAAVELPLSSYASATFMTDSQFLFGVFFLERHLGVGTACLLVAVAATVGCAAAVGVAWGRFARASLVASIAFLGLFAVLSTVEDLRETNNVRAGMPAHLTWIDKASAGRRVTAVATTFDPSGALREQLFWNTSIQREVTAPGAASTDVFNAPSVRIGARGTMTNVKGDVLFDDTWATGVLADATVAARVPGFTLWRPTRRPRFRLLITDRYPTGWLGYGGAIQAWPLSAGRDASISFDLSLPRGWKAAKLKLGATTVTVRPGHSTRVTCVGDRGPVVVPYSSPDGIIDTQLVRVIARMTNVRVADVVRSPGPRRAAQCGVVS